MAIRSGTIVAALTSTALAAVGVLAWQAQGAPDHTGAPNPAATALRHPAPSASPSAPAEPAVPDGSGRGKRIVYALALKRIWLVGADGSPQRTFLVAPGSVSPRPGSYRVYSRHAGQLTGTDGMPVRHVVRFAYAGTTIGFSETVEGALPSAVPTMKAGGVRELTADGEALWQFAPIGTTVVVVP